MNVIISTYNAKEMSKKDRELPKIGIAEEKKKICIAPSPPLSQRVSFPRSHILYTSH